MKRTMKFLARLYPSGWRARYGDELECLLEETRPSARDAFDVLWGALKRQITTWSFRRIMLACAAAGILAATAISFAVPAHSIDYPDPRVAQKVDSELITRFLESHARMLVALPDSRSTFRVLDPPNLPQAPAGPNRTRFAEVGLFTGILCGVMLAIVARTRRNTAVGNG